MNAGAGGEGRGGALAGCGGVAGVLPGASGSCDADGLAGAGAGLSLQEPSPPMTDLPEQPSVSWVKYRRNTYGKRHQPHFKLCR